MKWWYEDITYDALDMFNGNKSKAAKYLDIEITTLRKWCKELWENDNDFPYYKSHGRHLQEVEEGKKTRMFPSKRFRIDYKNNPEKGLRV